MSPRRTKAGSQGAERSDSFAASYMRAFPDSDLESLQAHLSLAAVSTALAYELEARVGALGFDLTRPRYTVVRTLYLSTEKTLAQSELAQMMGVSGPYMTQLIDALADDGWVERIIKRPDRRVTHVQLTSEGRQRCARLVPAIVEYMIASVRSLTPDERAQLAYLTAKVQANLSADSSK